jgi:hypothetical protein|tara:strand:+ start:19183 stop:19473 length:291 start_codon:yes stop_codon:yes gene_type:complete
VGLCTLTSLCRFTSAEIKAGDGLDYSKLAFYPDRWKQKKVDTPLFPWVGENITFLPITDFFEPKVMTKFIGNLDKGWATLPQVHRKNSPHAPQCRE